MKYTPSVFSLKISNLRLNIVKNMKITCSDSRVFNLTAADGTFLGKLEYEKWKSFTASLTTQFAEFYDITTKGFWGTKIVVKKDDNEFAELHMSWRGDIIIDLADDDSDKSYILKSHGLWKNYYELEDRWGNKLLVLRPDFNWKSTYYNYTIEANPDFEVNEMLVLLAVYCSNYLMTMMAAAA
jgi:hypothetical protein